MLIYASKIIGTRVLSVQAGGAIGEISKVIVDPNDLKVIAFRVGGGVVARSNANILDVSSIREYSSYGMVIDEIEELVEPEEVTKIKDVLDLNFDLIDLKVETKKGSKLGKVIDFTMASEDFMTQQIIVQRPTVKRLLDPELTIPRGEIVEVTDYKIIVKDEEKVIRKKAENEDFVPNFVNPFREPGFAPADSQNPDESNIE